MTTIAAIATPPGNGALAVIRLSGPDTFAIIRSVFQPRKPGRNYLKPWTVSAGVIRDADTGEIIDEVILSVFRAPVSYTGEDMAEISCHGGSAVAGAVLGMVMARGAAPAGPGEFTRRAFENGKLDLSRAEAVAELTAAVSESERKLALRMLHGGLSTPLKRIRAQILQVLTALELDLDFPEEEPEIPLHDTLNVMEALTVELEDLIQAGQRGDALRRGLNVVLAGPVNAGKSRLFNRLIGRDRAIVADEPGTTRDTLEGLWEHREFSVTLLDTAGLRKTDSVAETEAIRRSKNAFAAADLILFVIDGASPDLDSAEFLGKFLGEIPLAVVWNKSDIAGPPGPAHLATLRRQTGSATILPVSARTGEGVDDLRRLIAAHARAPGETGSALLLTLRQQALLEDIRDHVRVSGNTLRGGEPPECAVPDLRAAYEKTGEITGDHLPPDVLTAIFSSFCIGK